MPDNKTPLPSDPDEPIFGSQPTNPALIGECVTVTDNEVQP